MKDITISYTDPYGTGRYETYDSKLDIVVEGGDLLLLDGSNRTVVAYARDVWRSAHAV